MKKTIQAIILALLTAVIISCGGSSDEITQGNEAGIPNYTPNDPRKQVEYEIEYVIKETKKYARIPENFEDYYSKVFSYNWEYDNAMKGIEDYNDTVKKDGNLEELQKSLSILATNLNRLKKSRDELPSNMKPYTYAQ